MKKHLVISILAPVVFFSADVLAATVLNGSMNATGSVNVQTFNAVQPDGWQDIDLSTSTDIFDATTSFNGFTWAESSDGGTFVHALGPVSIIPGEGIVQEITGLTIGVTYAVNFEQSISRSNNAGQGDGGHWEVVFGSETSQSDYMMSPDPGVAFGWENQSLLFTAAAETQNLSFQAVPPDFGDRIGLGLDGVSISVVPIPAALWLFGSALAGLVWLKQKQAAQAKSISA